MRRIVSLGADSRFAVCDDGAVFFWTGQTWVPWDRPPIPQPTEAERLYAASQHPDFIAFSSREAADKAASAAPPAANAAGTGSQPSAAPKKSGGPR